jgi:hypothetical protein
MYQAIVAMFALLVGGCAGGFSGLPAPEASKAIGGAKTVGVVSAIGHKFTLQKVGITVFGNELNEVPIDSWGIDDAVANKVSVLLGSRFTVKRINFPKETFASYEKPSAFTDSSAVLQGIVRNLAVSQKHDLYVVVTRAGVPFGNTNQTVAGLGMIEAGGTLNPDNVHLFAIITVHLYNGQTFQQLHWQRAEFSIGSSLLGNVINGPHRRLDRTWWPANSHAVHNDRLKSATRALVEQSLATTIPDVMQSKTAERASGKKEP